MVSYLYRLDYYICPVGITFVTEQEEMYESRGSCMVLWEGEGEILLHDSIRYSNNKTEH